MAVLTSVYTRLSLIMWYMHLMLAPILLFCQVEERGKKKKTRQDGIRLFYAFLHPSG